MGGFLNTVHFKHLIEIVLKREIKAKKMAQQVRVHVYHYVYLMSSGLQYHRY